MILHIVSQSPFSHDALARCLAVVAPADAILLIEDGVFALCAAARLFSGHDLQGRLHVLSADAQARGVTAPADLPVITVEYDGFVSLVAQYSRTVSWF